jgi:LuxR family maltose regulon positive regulatory protein
LTFTDTSLSPDRTRPVLLATKLHAPALRAVRVRRERLFERLEAGAALPLTLVSAPAGFGKSTLIGDWLGQSGRPWTWVSLDAGDSDLRRFLRYFLAALERPMPGVGRALSGLLVASDLPEDPETLLGALLNELWERDGCIVVLDDYHLLQSQAVDAAMSFLVERLPPSLRLVMATRSDPDLPLPRLRARGWLGEIRAQDLRFTPGEAAAFLREGMGLALSPEQVEAVGQKTEGWIAGLQLAALSLRGRDDVGAALASFTGSHRFVLDYLSEEVLERQPPGRLDFLLQTSILPRLSASLCDAVTGRADAQETLAALEAGNLFLIPLDDSRTWYRYHHLFGGLLADRLEARIGKDGTARLRERAADWFAAQGLVEESMEQALAAGDEDRAARLLLEHAGPALHRGEFGQLCRWFEALSEGCFERHPRLSIPQGLLLFGSFRFPEIAAVEARLARAAAAADDPELTAGHAAIRVLLLTGRGDPSEVAELAERARAAAGPDRFSLKALVSVIQWVSHLRQVDGGRAAELLAEGAERALAAGNLTLAVVARSALATLETYAGHLRLSALRCRQTIDLFSPWGAELLPAAGPAFCALAEVLQEQGDLDGALAAIETSTRLTQRGRVVGNHIRGLSVAARIHQARGSFASARACFDEVAAMIRRVQVPAWEVGSASLGARLDLSEGLRTGQPELVARAVRWAEGLGLAALIERPEEHLFPDLPADFELLTVAHLLVRTGRREEALRLLPRIAALAESHGWMRSRIEAALLEAVARLLEGEAAAAAAAFAKALELAGPEGFLQVLLDEAPDLPGLLAVAEKHRPAALAAPFAGRLRQALGGAAPRSPVPPLPHSTGPDPVSDRELEILGLIATGLSNADVARRLYISPHTVKKHLENVYGKLGVKNRTEAIARLQAEGRLAASH